MRRRLLQNVRELGQRGDEVPHTSAEQRLRRLVELLGADHLEQNFLKTRRRSVGGRHRCSGQAIGQHQRAASSWHVQCAHRRDGRARSTPVRPARGRLSGRSRSCARRQGRVRTAVCWGWLETYRFEPLSRTPYRPPRATPTAASDPGRRGPCAAPPRPSVLHERFPPAPDRRPHGCRRAQASLTAMPSPRFRCQKRRIRAMRNRPAQSETDRMKHSETIGGHGRRRCYSLCYSIGTETIR